MIPKKYPARWRCSEIANRIFCIKIVTFDWTTVLLRLIVSFGLIASIQPTLFDTKSNRANLPTTFVLVTTCHNFELLDSWTVLPRRSDFGRDPERGQPRRFLRFCADRQIRHDGLSRPSLYWNAGKRSRTRRIKALRCAIINWKNVTNLKGGMRSFWLWSVFLRLCCPPIHALYSISLCEKLTPIWKQKPLFCELSIFSSRESYNSAKEKNRKSRERIY